MTGGGQGEGTTWFYLLPKIVIKRSTASNIFVTPGVLMTFLQSNNIAVNVLFKNTCHIGTC